MIYHAAHAHRLLFIFHTDSTDLKGLYAASAAL